MEQEKKLDFLHSIGISNVDTELGRAVYGEIFMLRSDTQYLGIQAFLKKTQQLSIKDINWSMLFKNIIACYNENHTKPIYTKYRVSDFESR